MATHYQTLGVAPHAGPEQIRKAYRALARSLHPDVNPSKDATRAFARVAAAYEVLSDPEKRREYDRTLAAKAARAVHAPERPASDLRQGHYTWVNVAGRPSDTDRDISEIDELYDTFFNRAARKRPDKTPQKPDSHAQNGGGRPRAAQTQGKPKRARKRSI